MRSFVLCLSWIWAVFWLLDWLGYCFCSYCVDIPFYSVHKSLYGTTYKYDARNLLLTRCMSRQVSIYREIYSRLFLQYTSVFWSLARDILIPMNEQVPLRGMSDHQVFIIGDQHLQDKKPTRAVLLTVKCACLARLEFPVKIKHRPEQMVASTS